MSDDYFLDCKSHQMAVHITDNKANPPTDKELLRMFIVCHGTSIKSVSNCLVVLESEHTIEWDHVINFKEKAREHERLCSIIESPDD